MIVRAKRPKWYTVFTFIMFFLPLLQSTGTVCSQESANVHEFSLKNGLKVIFVQDRSSPLVSIVVRVGAGAAYETQETSGISHLLEHLLFDGTFRRTARTIQNTIDENGAYLNAFTRNDYTAYEVVVPPDKLELAFDIQSDMLFYSTIPRDQLKKERKIVIEEIRKDLDYPASVTNDIFCRHLFKGTPYEYPVIGSEYNVLNLSRESIVTYYRTYYRPNNMTLIAVGDFDKNLADRLVNRYYGRIPASMIKPRATLEKYAISAGEYYARAQLSSTSYSMALSGPSPADKDAVAFEILTQLLVGSESGPLIHEVKKAGIPIIQAWGTYSQYRDFGYLELNFDIDSSFQELDMVKHQIRRTLEEYPVDAITEDEIERIKNKLIADLLFEKEKFLHYARFIAHTESLSDRPLWQTYEERLQKVDTTAVKEVFNRYLKSTEPLISVVQPYQEQALSSETVSIKTVKKTLDNGLTVIIRENRALAITGLNVLIKHRSLSEKMAGMSHFVSVLLEKGTESLSKADIQTKLEEIGGRLKVSDNPFFPFDNYYFTQEYDYLRLEFVSRYVDEGLELVKEVLFRPLFPESEIEDSRNNLLGMARMTLNHPRHKAKHLFYTTLLGEHPFARPLTGSIETITTFQRADLVEHHQRCYQPGNMILSIVGDVDSVAVIEKIERLFGSIALTQLVIDEPLEPQPVQTIVTVNESVQSEQASIYLGNILHFSPAEEAPLLILFSILNERLQNTIREGQGLAYSVGAGLHTGHKLSWYAFSASTGPDNIDRVINLMQVVLNSTKQSHFTDDELSRAINSEIGRSVRYHQRRINQAHYLSVAEFNWADYENDDTFHSKLKQVTIDDLRRIVTKLSNQTGYVIVFTRPSTTSKTSQPTGKTKMNMKMH